MERAQSRKQKILIADDSEMNRSILADMLGEEFEILEAENGVEAVALLHKHGTSIDLLLLDIVMPEMDGFGVLTAMNKFHWIEDIPVIMISSESTPIHIERAYNLGITDFISRPFDAMIVHRRVVNTILLYAKQKKLVAMVADQIYEKEQRSSLMIDILSHIVEFRNGESGQHVLHIRTLTELMLEHLIHMTDRYPLSQANIVLISTASALHDVGKIAIPSEILNKPGKLTKEEFEIMKTHSAMGAQMMDALPIHQDDPLVKTAHDICRWHHERWDGRGYPDGLKGDEIPISAQIVALADVYDALTSERVYKPAFSHETAVHMILDGQCGCFNPLLLQCLSEISESLPKEMESRAVPEPQRDLRTSAQELLSYTELGASQRTLQLLEHERMKYSFYAAMSQEIQFEFACEPDMLTLSAWSAEKLGLNEIVMNPFQNDRVRELMEESDRNKLRGALRNTTPEQPLIHYNCQIAIGGERRWHQIIAHAIWTADEPHQYTGCIGKAVDVHDERVRVEALERMASHDTLTGLLNHVAAKERIKARLNFNPHGRYAILIMDLDNFKEANDTYGHIFGDHVLSYTAEVLRQSIRDNDIAARAGGDEFLVFIEYHGEVEPVVERIFHCISGHYGNFSISVSMGVSLTGGEDTIDYTELFHRADQALYAAKAAGKGQFRFYDASMRDMLSVISPIDGSGVSAGAVGAE